MRRLILCISVAIITAISYQYVSATENNSGEETEMKSNITPAVNINDYISGVYNSIHFDGCNRLDTAVFNKAMYGYLNLMEAGKLTNPDILTICDFSQSSTAYRLWVIDLTKRTVLFNDHVAHGQGSGEEFATQFSNRMNSHQSSLGFYVTAETYMGEHGLSLKLQGMDNGFNNAAYERDVVVHGADYVSSGFISKEKRLGRSWGCPAVSTRIAPQLIQTIKNGTCLFIYYPSEQYLKTAYWLNKKIDLASPSTNTLLAALPKQKRDTVVVYETEALKERLTNNRL